MRKFIASILFCSLLCQGGCQFVAQWAEPSAELVVVDEAAQYSQKDNGKKYSQLSKNFDISVYPSRIVIDKSQNHSINYNFDVENKTQSTFKNLQAVLLLDPSMEKFIQNGTTIYSPRELTLVPEEVAQKNQSDVWGIQIGNSAALFSQEQLEELELSIEDMLPIARKIQIQLE